MTDDLGVILIKTILMDRTHNGYLELQEFWETESREVVEMFKGVSLEGGWIVCKYRDVQFNNYLTEIKLHLL